VTIELGRRFERRSGSQRSASHASDNSNNQIEGATECRYIYPVAARRYAGKSGAERRAERRAQLLDAALALFGTEGYAATSIAHVCEEAGIITRYFYESFETREALLVAVYDRIIEETEQRVRVALAEASSDPIDRMAGGLRAFLHSYLDDPRRGRIVCLEVVGVSPGLERHRREDVWRFAKIIVRENESLVRAGLLPDRDSRYTARALAGATHELIVERLTAPRTLSVERLEREVLLLYVATFSGSGAASAWLQRTEVERTAAPRPGRTKRP
jgi:AcrR family transcriptional regulator